MFPERLKWFFTWRKPCENIPNVWLRTSLLQFLDLVTCPALKVHWAESWVVQVAWNEMRSKEFCGDSYRHRYLCRDLVWTDVRMWWQLLQGLTFIFPPERTEGITSLYRLYRLNVTKHTLVCCTAPVSSLHFGAVACKTFPWRRLHWSMEYCDFFIMAKIPCLCTSLLVRSVVFWAFWRAGWNWLNEQCHGGPFSLCCLWRPCGLYKKILFPLVAPSTHW